VHVGHGVVDSSVSRAVHCIENHDEAYLLWRGRGFHNRVLVHVDAHHDMWWTSDSASLTIANFICPALRDGIVRELYWVVPDATWQTKAGRAALQEHLRMIRRGYREKAAPPRIEDHRIRTVVLGRPFVICSLDGLPAQTERVLLDIDTDYLVIPTVTYGCRDPHQDLPWRWPHELHERLQATRVEAELVTVAYSVEGGHTPLRWKYLGDEISHRFQTPDRPRELLQAYETMREAVMAAHRGDKPRAATLLRSIGNAIGSAPYFHLALLAITSGDVDRARNWYQRALAHDPSYRIVCETASASSQNETSRRRLERSARAALLLDPSNASAHVALGWVAMRRAQWRDAERRARTALDDEPDLIDAHRLLGQALAGQGQLQDAIGACERSLTLALAGHRPLNGIITSQRGSRRLLDSDHARTHAHLADLYARNGDHRRAIVAFRMAIAGGIDSTAIRFRLAVLYLRWREWRGAIHQVAAGFKAMTRWWRTGELSA
jgi:tetratricopeptide (TPR) repeat protein